MFFFQFLKKVQRQERIVEEIKTVLKPHYNRKRITKEDYKNILRKCVPKVCKWHFRISKVDSYFNLDIFFLLQVCHSKKGDINPTKIQKLVKGYVRKYKATRKKGAGPFPM